MTKYINIGLLVMIFQPVSMAGPEIEELLDDFTETLDRVHVSFITKAKCTTSTEHKYQGEWAKLSGKRTRYHLQEFRTDGKRMKHILQQWGDFARPSGKLIVRSENDKTYRSDTYDGEKRYENNKDGITFIHTRNPENSFTLESKFDYEDHVSKCFGYLNGDQKRLDRILREAKPGQVSLRNEMEYLNGTAHYVVDAKTERGEYTVWFNSEKGYHYSKAAVIRRPGDLFREKVKIEPGHQREYVVETTQFTEVDGVWVPTKARTRAHNTLPDGDYAKASSDIELISIVMNPDHDAMGSFLIDDIEDGAKVRLVGVPGRFVWRNGKAVPEDQ